MSSHPTDNHPYHITNPRACPICHCDTVGLDLKTLESICFNCKWRAPSMVQTAVEDHRTGKFHIWLRSVPIDEIQDILAGRRECDCERCQNQHLHRK